MDLRWMKSRFARSTEAVITCSNSFEDMVTELRGVFTFVTVSSVHVVASNSQNKFFDMNIKS